MDELNDDDDDDSDDCAQIKQLAVLRTPSAVSTEMGDVCLCL